LALKFQNFFKRWLQIFYPREISTSLEEKNRQLMSLMDQYNQNHQNNGVLFHDLTNDENQQAFNGGTTAMFTNSPLNGGTENASTNSAEDKSNETSAMAIAMAKHLGKMQHSAAKKRSVNPDKDKYIQEPQYVTKRTSSGRLVKMKISTDYDYTSDQELEAKKKKSMLSIYFIFLYILFP
jgi:isochorismate synthase EntC